MGIINTCINISQIVTPIIFGLFYSIEHRLPFIIAAFITLICIFAIILLYYTTKENDELVKYI